jgi:hypothetical protein
MSTQQIQNVYFATVIYPIIKIILIIKIKELSTPTFIRLFCRNFSDIPL